MNLVFVGVGGRSTEAHPDLLVSKWRAFMFWMEGIALRWQELVWTSMTGEEAMLDLDGSL